MLTIENKEIASVIETVKANKRYDHREQIDVFNQGGFVVRCKNNDRAIKAVGTKFKKKRKEVAFKDQFKEPSKKRLYSKLVLSEFLEGRLEQDLINSVEYFKTHRKTAPVFAKFIKEYSDANFYNTLIIDTKELLLNGERVVVTGNIPALRTRGVQWCAIDLKSGVIISTNHPTRKVLIEKLQRNFNSVGGVETIINHVKKNGFGDNYQELMRGKYYDHKT